MKFNVASMVTKISLMAITLFMVANQSFSQDWDIPDNEKIKTSPITFNDDLKTSGKAIYEANCKSCHGDPGKGNHADLDPIPIDPASRKFQEHTDGEIFYILRTGRGLMPSFSGVLTEMERWAAIAYIRSYNPSYIQPPLAEIVDLDLTGSLLLTIKSNIESKKVFAHLIDTTNGQAKPIANAQIKLMVKRMFGNLNIGEASSNQEGIAEFSIPNNLPGDTIGNITIMAIAGSEGKEVRATSIEPLGVVTKPEKLLSKRAWWNKSRMAPIWLIATYTFCLLGGLLAVAYVLMLLYKIKMYNSPKTE